MKNLFIALFQKIIQRHLTDVPLSSIRCEKRKVSLEEGWGGKTIEYFPPCKFFKIAIADSQQKAVNAMEEWYYDRLINNHLYAVPKIDGGMENGSLCRLISELHRKKDIEMKKDFSNAHEKIVRQAIKMRTLDRFDLLNSISTNGYHSCGDYVSVRKEGDIYIIIHGHHRIAALSACAYKSVAAAISRPMVLKLATKAVKLLLRKQKDYHSEETKKILSQQTP